MKKIRKAKDGTFWYLGAPYRTRRSPIKIYKIDKNKKLTKEDIERLKASAITFVKEEQNNASQKS